MSQTKATTTVLNGSQPTNRPDAEVVARAKRRRFSRAYKLRILQEAEQCTQSGQIGTLLRREGLYSSHLSDWRRERDAGQWQMRTGQKRGRKLDSQAAELISLRRENEQLRTQVSQAEFIIAAQKKLTQSLESILTKTKDKPL